MPSVTFNITAIYDGSAGSHYGEHIEPVKEVFPEPAVFDLFLQAPVAGRDAVPIPIDLRNFNHILYQGKKIKELQKKLKNRVEAFLK